MVTRTDKKVRLFIGLPIPEDVVRELHDKLRGYRSYIKKTVPMENWHITVMFMGEVGWQEDKLALLGEKMPQAFIPTVTLTHIGKGTKEDQLWVYVRSTKVLSELREQIKNRINQAKLLGGELGDCRLFTPHVTLATLRADRNTRLVADEPVSAMWRADKLYIYRSELRASGAQYYREGLIDLRAH